MDYKLAKQFSDDYIQSLYPGIDYEIGACTLYKAAKLDKEDFVNKIKDFIESISIRKNFPIYWYNVGVRDNDLIKLYMTSNGKYISCLWCSKIFVKGTSGANSKCCSPECIGNRKEKWKQNLSESRLKYNNKDPIQYAERHGISVEEATELINKVNQLGSRFTIEYWTSRGYSEEEAKENIIRIQRKNSPRCVEYWVNKGYTLEEAEEKVSEVQIKNSETFHEKYKDLVTDGYFSILSKNYWTSRGYSEEEAKENISALQRERANNYINSVPAEVRRRHNHFCIEYWEERHGKNAKELYTEHLQKTIGNSFTSKISNDLFDELTRNIPKEYKDKYIQYGEREFTILHDGNCFMYDFVDKNKKVCVEFNGDYWHANPERYAPEEEISYPNNTKRVAKDIWEADAYKNMVMEEQRGYRVIVIWEADVRKDFVSVINELKRELNYEDR